MDFGTEILKTEILPEDYEVDGLLFCGKCKTPKQCITPPFGKVSCMCKCKQEQNEKEQEQKRQEEFNRRIDDLRINAFPDKDMRSWTFEKDDNANAKHSTYARNYVKRFDEIRKKDNNGLLFYGSVGTGKTFISACIANALIDRGISCFVTNFSRLVNEISGMFEGKQEYIDSLNNFDLLVIDDLASERDTEYMGEIIHSIIDGRYRAKLPIIITTNLSAEEFKKPSDIRKKRIYSRLFEMCYFVEVIGKDRRKQKLRENYNELKQMLEGE